jgi:hypothetical protein
MDLATGIVQQIRNHAWLNAFNFLILLALCAKHDVKVLLTKLHALAVVFYVVKYKPEATLHSKIMIAALVVNITVEVVGKCHVTNVINLSSLNPSIRTNPFVLFIESTFRPLAVSCQSRSCRLITFSTLSSVFSPPSENLSLSRI